VVEVPRAKPMLAAEDVHVEAPRKAWEASNTGEHRLTPSSLFGNVTEPANLLGEAQGYLYRGGRRGRILLDSVRLTVDSSIPFL